MQQYGRSLNSLHHSRSGFFGVLTYTGHWNTSAQRVYVLRPNGEALPTSEKTWLDPVHHLRTYCTGNTVLLTPLKQRSNDGRVSNTNFLWKVFFAYFSWFVYSTNQEWRAEKRLFGEIQLMLRSSLGRCFPGSIALVVVSTGRSIYGTGSSVKSCFFFNGSRKCFITEALRVHSSCVEVYITWPVYCSLHRKVMVVQILLGCSNFCPSTSNYLIILFFKFKPWVSKAKDKHLNSCHHSCVRRHKNHCKQVFGSNTSKNLIMHLQVNGKQS